MRLGSGSRPSRRANQTQIGLPNNNHIHSNLRRGQPRLCAGSAATPLRHEKRGKSFIHGPTGRFIQIRVNQWPSYGPPTHPKCSDLRHRGRDIPAQHPMASCRFPAHANQQRFTQAAGLPHRGSRLTGACIDALPANIRQSRQAS